MNQAGQPGSNKSSLIGQAPLQKKTSSSACAAEHVPRILSHAPPTDTCMSDLLESRLIKIRRI